jgi:hypothetical protein
MAFSHVRANFAMMSALHWVLSVLQMAKTQKNKATMGHLGMLKVRFHDLMRSFVLTLQHQMMVFIAAAGQTSKA